MDLTQAIIAKSDQLNASDLISGPRDFTITEVREGNSDQPCQIFLAEWPERPFKPSKTVMRMLSYGWGSAETDDWPPGARMRLFRDPTAKWAGEEVGGIRVSHMSHIPKPFKIALRESQKKSVLYTVDPLPDVAAEPTRDELAAQAVDGIYAATTEAEVREWGNRAHARAILDVRVRAETVKSHVTSRLAELEQANERPADGAA